MSMTTATRDMRGQPTERPGRERGGGGLGGELNPEEGFLTGIELERVETLLRERSAEMTRTRASTQLHPSLDGVVFLKEERAGLSLTSELRRELADVLGPSAQVEPLAAGAAC